MALAGQRAPHWDLTAAQRLSGCTVGPLLIGGEVPALGLVGGPHSYLRSKVLMALQKNDSKLHKAACN